MTSSRSERALVPTSLSRGAGAAQHTRADRLLPGAGWRLRRRPNDTLLSALVAAEEQGDRLTRGELLANAVLLLMNGRETTTYMIGNGLLALLFHPDPRQHLQAEPSLIGSAVEELLRYDGSVQMRGVTAAEDLSIGDKRIGKGRACSCYLAQQAATRRGSPTPTGSTSADETVGTSTSGEAFTSASVPHWRARSSRSPLPR